MTWRSRDLHIASTIVVASPGHEPGHAMPSALAIA